MARPIPKCATPRAFPPKLAASRRRRPARGAARSRQPLQHHVARRGRPRAGAPPARGSHRRSFAHRAPLREGLSRPARTRSGPRTPSSWSTSSPATSRPARRRSSGPPPATTASAGSWVGPRMGYESVVILPEEMSAERFEKIAAYGARAIKTPGCESNVKEIYDECKRLAANPRVRIMNQFAEMANYRWHYHVTGAAAAEAVETLGAGRPAAFVSAMGSAGTIAAGDALKARFGTRIVGLEPVQCPTLSCNGYGGHAIEGIGDKHVTWIHHVTNLDAMMCIDDEECLLGLQLVSRARRAATSSLRAAGSGETAHRLSTLLGISGVCNILGAIKTARWLGLGKDDAVVTVATDGLDRYPSVLSGSRRRTGPLTRERAEARLASVFHGQKLDWIAEGTRENRERWHNLKYFTWVEQQGKTVEELDAQRSETLVERPGGARRRTWTAGSARRVAGERGRRARIGRGRPRHRRRDRRGARRRPPSSAVTCSSGPSRAARSTRRAASSCPGSSSRTRISTRRSRAGWPPRRNRTRSFREILERVWWRLDAALDESSLEGLGGRGSPGRGALGSDGRPRPPRVPVLHRRLPRRPRAGGAGGRRAGRARLRGDGPARAGRGGGGPRRVRARDPRRPARDGGPARRLHGLGRDASRRPRTWRGETGPGCTCTRPRTAATRTLSSASTGPGLSGRRRSWPTAFTSRRESARASRTPAPGSFTTRAATSRTPSGYADVEDLRPARRPRHGRDGRRSLHGSARRASARPGGVRAGGRNRRDRSSRPEPASRRRGPRAAPGGLDRPRLRPAHAADGGEPRGTRSLRPRRRATCATSS